MNYYFVANIEIKDEKEYQKYLDNVDEVFNKYGGKYLAVDDKPKILEGNWSYTRTVLIKFPSKDDFQNWYHSEEYQTILEHRLNSANRDTILIRGKD